MDKNKIPMKTYDMDKHCSLLLIRILEEFNIDIDYNKDRIGVFSSKCNHNDDYETREILLGYTKLLHETDTEKEYGITILLSDHGHESVLDSYMDEESFNTVHDVSVKVIISQHKGRNLNLSFEKLKEINRKVLMDIDSTRVNNHIYFLNKDSLVTKKHRARDSIKLYN